MKLERVQIKNFRSIEDSTEFKISDVTCLVGKNEIGKTNVLQAVEKLNAYEKGRSQFDEVRDYPRKYLPDFKDRHPDGKAIVVETVWRLSDLEARDFEETFGAKFLKSREVRLCKGYGYEKMTCSMSVDLRAGLRHLASDAGCTAEETKSLKGLTTRRP